MLREMTPADVDTVLAIEQTVQPYPWTRGNFMDALSNGNLCRVDEVAGEIRGYAVLMPVADEAELLAIGVAATHQRKGLGRALLEAVLAWARGLEKTRVFLEVRSSNTAAVALYQSAGFAQIGVRRNYYRNAGRSEDALTMACDITLSPSPSPASGRGEIEHRASVRGEIEHAASGRVESGCVRGVNTPLPTP